MSALICRGSKNPRVLVVCDVPSHEVHAAGTVMGRGAGERLREEAEAAGLPFAEIAFLTPCPPFEDERTAKSDRRVSEYLAGFHEEFHRIASSLRGVRLVICLGKYAAQQWNGRPVKITKARGTVEPGKDGKPACLMMYSPGHTLVRPEVLADFRADLRMGGNFRASGWDLRKQQSRLSLGKYEWKEDITYLLKSPPPMVYADTETRGLKWIRKPGTLVIQLCWEEGEAIMVPLCERYYPDITAKQVERNKASLRKLFGNPKVRVLGHNFKYDLHMLDNEGIEVANWHGDTIQMAFAVDENMERKNQADCVKRWLPELSGYSDEFDREVDKSRMWEVPHDKMLQYGCGDVDSGLRLAYKLYELGQRDKRNWACYEKVQMPALRMFFKMEKQGLRLDTEALRKLGHELGRGEAELYQTMMRQVPAKIRRKHMTNEAEGGRDTGLSFTRDAFVRDILFSKDGLRVDKNDKKFRDNKNIHESGRLIPKIFTDAEELPSVSTKQHMPYFERVPFVDDFVRYEKLTKMQSTYVGEPGSTETVKVMRLKSGKLTKRLVEALEDFFVVKQKRPDLFEKVSNGARWRQPPVIVPVGDGVDVRVSGAGLHWLKHMAPTGFWKYLTPEQRIHSNIRMDVTVTGRSASREPNCFDAKTEVLTRRGWVPMPKLLASDEVAQWLPGGQITFVRPSLLTSRKFTGEMVHVTNEHIDLRITEDHRCLLQHRKTGGNKVFEAWNYKSDWRQLHAGLYQCDGGYSNRDYLRLLVATQADGSFTPLGHVDFSFKKRRKYERLLQLLASVGVSFRDYSKNGRFRVYVDGAFSKEAFRILGKDKLFDPYWWLSLASEDMDAVLGELPLWDGCSTTRTMYASKHKQNADVMQALYTLRGQRAKVRLYKNSSGARVWQIDNTPRNYSLTTNAKVIKRKVNGEQVYCLSVPSTYVVVRRNGRTAVTGQCQNIPKHSEFSPAFRRVFVPSPGFVLIEADLSQIELRIAAWMARDRKMLEIFRTGGDIHTATAARLLNITVEQFNRLPDEEREHKRFLAKAVNFGFIYGQWPEGFQQYAKAQYKIDLTLDDAEEFRDSYFELYADLGDWHKSTEKFVRQNGFVRSLHGALRRLPSVDSDSKGIRNGAVRQAVNSPVQRFASDLALMGMFRFGRDCDWNKMRPLGFVHDAVIMEARESCLKEAATAMRWYMQSAPIEKWFDLKAPLPITADISTGPNLCEMTKRKDWAAKRPKWARED